MRVLVLRRLLPALLLLSVLVVACGCGREFPASASGTVALNGGALKHRAVLTFMGPDHTPRSTETDEHGAFQITDLPVGATAVMVSSIPDGGPAARPLGMPNQKTKTDSRLARPATRTLTQTTEIPAEYGDASHPLLTYTIQEGDNQLTINLVIRTK
jgi:hypothetical protein